MERQRLGKFGEKIAFRYLQEKGYNVRGRNYRCAKGEIDIVADKDKVIHFVEVKTRQGHVFGHPAESVTPQKVGNMKAAAIHYLESIKGTPEAYGSVQFDVIEIELNHIENI